MLLGGIADDLTGAVEFAGMLAAGGMRVALVLDDAPIPHGQDAVVVALPSRVAPVGDAVAAFGRAADALLGAGAERLFFKYCATFDSTPAGNIGPCADLLMDRVGADFTLFAPSFPEAERRVFMGHLFVGSQLVSNSPKRFDPLTPMTEPDLVKVLAPQTSRRVGLLPLPVILRGAEAVARHVAALRAEGISYAIADAGEEEDLATLARASWDWRLATGGSNLASHYPAIWREKGLLAPADAMPPLGAGGHGVVLAGSCADRTREQVDCFGARHPVMRVDLARMEAPEAALREAVEWALPKLEGGPVCVTTAGDPQAVSAAQARFGRDGAARAAEGLLGGLAKALVDAGARRILVAGGESSGAVIRSLGIARLSVAPYVSPGIGLCAAEAPVPLALCLKSGKLGPVDMFATVLEGMRA
ncbi:four-carbon acid sugar kinase family protein [Roseomonas sp. SSH11]|uniref:3-oxo-tetronate kinase n=1 Tax=Pararoseomonas baculiformis TaxID=2820812 RepID=A0ABS4AH41_9PROT|nr:3-oxo-tetronate kinase [Pararoseomonas baculiformis]MBP0446338.1 four-carbon acid sugar kinase family protein [Pararoseomonas baculiformis]